MSNKKEMSTMLKFIYEQIDKVPLPEKKKEELKAKVDEIYNITANAREPRIALVGRRGAGKSSLINAMFKSNRQYVSAVKSGTGKAKWLWYPSENEKKIRLLDTRGLGESEKPTEDFTEETPMEELKKAILEEMPDVFLFLIKAKETDAHVKQDLDDLKTIRDFIKQKFDYEVPVICVITQVDELDPPMYKSLPLDANPKKAKNIGEAITLMDTRFEEAGIPLIKTIPVSAYIDFDEEGNIEYDLRWNIDELTDFLLESLPNEARLKMARASRITKAKKKYAYSIIGIFTTITGIVGGVNNIPIADLPIITAIQVLMVTLIAFIAGKEISSKTAAEFITALGVNIGVAFVVREGARALVKFFPGVGNLISGGIAITVTGGIGYAAVKYFIDEGSIEDAKKAYKNYEKKDETEF